MVDYGKEVTALESVQTQLSNDIGRVEMELAKLSPALSAAQYDKVR